MLREWARRYGNPRCVDPRRRRARVSAPAADVRAIAEAGRGISGDPALTSRFFWEEYELIRHIHRYPKPYLAIIDGITMGGGAEYRSTAPIALPPERTMLGARDRDRPLSRCRRDPLPQPRPGHIGRYLALTGVRLGPEDARYCGFAHAFRAARACAPAGRGARPLWHGGRARRAHRSGRRSPLRRRSGEPPLALRRAAIDRCFAPDTVEAVLDALTREAAAGGSDAEWQRGPARGC